MRVAVIGASGRTGRQVVRVLRERGAEVVAVVRDAGRAPQEADEVRVADARDATALAQAVANTDAVVSCLGPVRGESASVMSDSIGALLAAVRAESVRRLVVVTATGWVVDGDDPVSRFLAKPVLGRLIPEVNAGFEATEAAVRGSGLDWTIVRPPRLLDRPGAGRYRVRRDGNVRWGFSIARADLALAVADVVLDAST